MPRTIVPELDARVITDPSGTSFILQMPFDQSDGVDDDFFVLMVGFRFRFKLLAHQLQQAVRRLIPAEMSLRVVKSAPAVRAARDECAGTGVVDLSKLVFHRAVAQRRRTLDVEHTAASAAAETESAMILELVELDAHGLHQRARRLVDAALAHQLARIMEGGFSRGGPREFQRPASSSSARNSVTWRTLKGSGLPYRSAASQRSAV